MTTKKPTDEDERTVRMPAKEPSTAKPASDYDERTVRLGGSTAAGASTKKTDERTVLVRGKSADAPAGASDDPVAGWLVVVNGPGRGSSVTVGYGQNAIGRDAKQRVALNFGDDQITRENHAVITYDPRGRKFYVQPGSGKNLTYLGDAPVLAPQELASGAHLMLGKTTLRFIALCGPDFDWDAEAKQ